jgi:hypothetical protein
MRRFRPVTVRLPLIRSPHLSAPSNPNPAASPERSSGGFALMLTSAVTTGHVMSMDELANVKGRGWEDIDVRGMANLLIFSANYMLTPIAALRNNAMRVSDMIALKQWSSEASLHAGTVRLACCIGMQLDACNNPFGRAGPVRRSRWAIPTVPDKVGSSNVIRLHRIRAAMGPVLAVVRVSLVPGGGSGSLV